MARARTPCWPGRPRCRRAYAWRRGTDTMVGKSVTDSKRVLVVDDEDAIRDVVAQVLDLEGYEVRTARNGAEALDQVRSYRPNIVLLDLMMPVMNGWEFLEACAQNDLCADTPVVVMSAYRGAGGEHPQVGA